MATPGMNGFGMRPGIILLREGTDTSQGKPQLVSNINACQAVADAIRTTLGPRGMDKLVFDGRTVTISNDGATIMRLLEIAHPAAKTLVDISMSQDAEVGDGTTSVVLLAGEILRQMKEFVEDGVHPYVIMKTLRRAGKMAVEKVSDLQITFDDDHDDDHDHDEGREEEKDDDDDDDANDDRASSSSSSSPKRPPSKLREMLLKCASTALNSKLIASHQDLFAPMVVDAVMSLLRGKRRRRRRRDDDDDADDDHDDDDGGALDALDDLTKLVAIKKVPGGDVRQSFLVRGGVAFHKTFSYAGFEQMTKKFVDPRILLLNVELEWKSERENAEVRISNPDDYQSIVDAEWQVIYDKLEACVSCGADIVLSKLPIGDLATQYFADRGLFCAGRVSDADMRRVAKATGGTVQTTTRGLHDGILGTCGLFEERQMGEERFNVFERCASSSSRASSTSSPSPPPSTIVLRGGSEQFIAESERSIHDALMVVRRCLRGRAVVAGGGAVEMEVSDHLRRHALSIEGKGQLIVSSYARALEIIPRQLCENAGFDPTDVLSALRRKHNKNKTTTKKETATTADRDEDDDDDDGRWYGVDIENGGICDTFASGVWEPSDNKRNSFAAATEAACVILSIDETVINPKSQDPGAAQSGMLPMQGGGPSLSNAMGHAMDHANAMKGGSRSGNLGNGMSWMKGRN